MACSQRRRERGVWAEGAPDEFGSGFDCIGIPFPALRGEVARLALAKLNKPIQVQGGLEPVAVDSSDNRIPEQDEVEGSWNFPAKFDGLAGRGD